MTEGVQLDRVVVLRRCLFTARFGIQLQPGSGYDRLDASRPGRSNVRPLSVQFRAIVT